MARNGSGTYTLPAGNPVITGTTISSTWANNTLTDVANALTGSIASDGQTTPSANLPMGNFAHTGVADATVRTMYSSAGQTQDSTATYLTSVVGTNAITATAPLGMSAYATGQIFRFVSAGANTGAATLNINSIGIKSITKRGTTALVAGDIPANAAVQVVYDGTQFQLMDPASVASVTAVTDISFGTTGLTPSTSTSGSVTVAGTLAIANGGTNNGSLAVTAGGVVYTDGTKLVNVGAGTSGQLLQSNGASAPTWATFAASGTLKNIQYFTTAGTATYTPTTGTNFVIVEVVGGGGGSSGGGGTSSFGALVSATGGSVRSTTALSSGGTGSSGDLNMTGTSGLYSSASTVTMSISGGFSFLEGYGIGSYAVTAAGAASGGGAGGGYARKKITSGFSGVTITVGAAGTGAGITSATSGIVIVYEYA